MHEGTTSLNCLCGKYTGLATFSPTELNSVAQKRKTGVGYMALSHNSKDTTGYHKINN